ncbi:MAG: hypothetical protein H9872_00215 [Candidatus Cellulosilyticum pullistercoris]|uniref:Copper amine oxidase-like N-terminal domain-containing protein n=1 Tax=Candidatus Cellulosilyticum pullistercoris TaxID=2838521 RepID=A0A9E2KAM4_9FIRM|nr:hypothetical protein [Candidatus Cellulosilyticum pullistercoris]
MKKKLLSMLLAITLLSSSATISAKEQKVNDDTIESHMETQEDYDKEAITTDEDVMIDVIEEKPIEINDNFLNEVDTEGEIIKGDEFILKLGSKKYTMNGSSYVLTAAPLSINVRTYLPLRFMVDEVLEATLNWNLDKQEGVLSKEEMSVQLKVGSRTILVNGSKTSLDGAPIVRNGTTYVPLKIVSDYLGCTVNYDASSKKIIIVGKDKGINNRPIAKFNFSQATYIAGQTVVTTSSSYDPDGHKLVAQEWEVIKEGSTVTNKELSYIFKKPSAGIYTIGLRVKDQYGFWSEWTYKELTILPNEAPKITYLGTERNTYAQGEKIKYQYFYDNESWEGITNEKWTYRQAEEEISEAILGRPDALFKEGTYIITLQIDDEYGNRSEIYETTVHITKQVLEKELSYRFTQGNIGDIIDNYQEFNYRDYEDAEIIHQSTVAGRMLMSDSPEEVSREGILYRDMINGKGRILMHHINRFSNASVVGGDKRLVIVAENTSTTPVTLTLSNKVIKGPVTDVLYVGQKLLYDYLVGSEDEVMVLQPGERRYIYDSGTKWQQETCISGLMDVSTTGEVTFTMAAVSAGSTINNMSSMEFLLQAVHPRGTFSEIAINYTLNLDGTKPTKLLIGTGEEEWVKGYDALTNEPAQNKGNYGVSYYITMTAEEDMGIILNPRANVFRGAIEWMGIGVYNIPTTGAIFNNTAKAISLGTIKAGETKTFEYMLPNGSAAPVLIGFIPKSYWDN